jgi:hypothetical protein
MADAAEPRPARYPNGRFGPGNPGRPLGARGRASRVAVLDILRQLELEQEIAGVLRKALAASRRRPVAGNSAMNNGEKPVSAVINGQAAAP